VVRVRSIDARQRAFGAAAADGAVDLQAPPARWVDGEEIVDDVFAERADVGEGGLLCFLEIAQHGGARP
jgi:hypothetical protein